MSEENEVNNETNNATEENKGKAIRKKIISGARYFFGVVLAIGGVLNKDWFFALCGISCLPIIYTLLHDKANLKQKTTNTLALVLPIVLFFASALTTTTYMTDYDKTLNVGETYEIVFTTKPENYTLVCSDENVISVEGDTVTAKQPGNAKVEMKIDNFTKDTLFIKVKEVEKPKTESEEKKDEVTTPEEKTEEITEEVTEEKSPEVIQQENELKAEQEKNDNVESLAKEIFEKSLKGNSKNRENLVIRPSSTELRVEYKIVSFWDSNDFLKKAISDYCNFAKEFYSKNNDITTIGFYLKAEYTDAYGNQGEQFVLKFSMNKENFQKFNLKNLEYKSIYDTFRYECDLFDMDNSLGTIKSDKVLYIPEN